MNNDDILALEQENEELKERIKELEERVSDLERLIKHEIRISSF